MACEFFFYLGCKKGYCATHQTLVGATRDLVKRHTGGRDYPAYIKSREGHVRGSTWKYAIVENDLNLHFPLKKVNVCSVCGKAKGQRWSKRKVLSHIALVHGGSFGHVLEGKGYFIPRGGVLVKTLNAAHVGVRVRQLHPLLREEDDDEDEDNVVEEAEEAEGDDEDIDDNVEGDDLSTYVRQYLQQVDNSSNGGLPPPKRVKAISHESRAGNPALYDLGIFRYNENVSQERLKELASYADPNFDEVENLLARAFVHIIRNVPGLLLDSNLQLRKILWTVDLTSLVAERDETEVEIPMMNPGRGFSEVTAKTLSKYSEIGIRLVIAALRIISTNQPNYALPIMRLARDVRARGLDPDESADKVVPGLLGFLNEISQHRPERGDPLLFIALKTMCIHCQFGAWQVLPVHQIAFILASIKYCLSGVHLNIYFGQIDANKGQKEALKYITSWTSSVYFSILNSTIKSAKMMKQPQRQKCEVKVRSFRDISLMLNENPDDTITNEEVRDGVQLGITLVREKLLSLFKDDVRAFFYPSSKNIRLTYINGVLHFVDETPSTESLLAKAFESVDEEALDDVETLSEETKKQRVTERLQSIQNILIALVDVCGDGNRRAAEFSCFYNRQKGFGDMYTFIRPGGFSFGDIRRISKRVSSDSIIATKAHIRHTYVISNLLLVYFHFGVKVLKSLKDIDNVFDRFFPLVDAKFGYLLEDMKKKHGGPSTEIPSKYKIEIADYSAEYSKMINLGLSDIFPSHKITMRKLREVHGLLQEEANEDRYQVWQGFCRAMSHTNHFAHASGHSVKTRRFWYTAHPSINGTVNPVMQLQDSELLADKYAFVCLGIAPLITSFEFPSAIRLGPVPDIASEVLATRGHQQPKCPEQLELIREVYQLVTSCTEPRSIIASLSCGSGKSIAIDTALKYKQPGDIIPLVLPTHVLINQKFSDYVNGLGYSVRKYDQDFNSWDSTDLLICTMDAAFSQSFIDAMVSNSSKIRCVIIDECHVLLDSTFRCRMYRAEFLLTYRIPVVFLSGTLPRMMHQCLTTRFLLRNPIRIRNNLIRRNMVYAVNIFDVRKDKLERNMENFKFLQMCRSHIIQVDADKILVVCSTIQHVNEFLEQDMDGKDIWGIHSEISDEDNDKTLRDFNDKGGILFSTAALGEGINIVALDHVFVVGTAYNMLKLVQYASRAGREDQKGWCNILYHMTEKGLQDEVRENGLCNLVPLQFHSKVEHLLTETGFRDWVLNDRICRLSSLAEEYGEPGGEDCGECDACLKKNPGPDDVDVAVNIKKNLCKAMVKKALRVLKQVCLLCGNEQCCKQPKSRCNLSFRRIEELSKGTVQTGSGNVWVRSCTSCAQCWAGPRDQVKRLEKDRQRHNDVALEFGGNGGICTQLPKGDDLAFPCYHCFLPHQFTDNCVHDYVARRLRNVILLVARDPSVATFIQTKLNVAFGECHQFNSYFIQLLKVIETDDYGPIPLSILIINTLVKIQGYGRGKALANYNFAYETWP